MPPESSSDTAYVDLESLKNAESLVAIISYHRSRGTLTFGVFKEYNRSGQKGKTAFIPEELADSYLDLTKIAVDRVRAIKDDTRVLEQLLAAQGVNLKDEIERRRKVTRATV